MADIPIIGDIGAAIFGGSGDDDDAIDRQQAELDRLQRELTVQSQSAGFGTNTMFIIGGAIALVLVLVVALK